MESICKVASATNGVNYLYSTLGKLTNAKIKSLMFVTREYPNFTNFTVLYAKMMGLIIQYWKSTILLEQRERDRKKHSFLYKMVHLR